MPNDPVSQQSRPQQLVATALKRERTRAGLSIAELARRAGIGKSTLSQLESGEGNPSVETLWALATALGLQFADLLDVPVRRVEVIRAADGPKVAAADADYSATLLSAAPPGTRRDLYRVRAEPGSPRVSAPHTRGMVEYVILSTGRARVGPVDDPVELGPGDFISYPGDAPHIFEALEPGTTAVMLNELG